VEGGELVVFDVLEDVAVHWLGVPAALADDRDVVVHDREDVDLLGRALPGAAQLVAGVAPPAAEVLCGLAVGCARSVAAELLEDRRDVVAERGLDGALPEILCA